MYRVIIADDHEVVLSGYRRLLSRTEKFDIVGEVKNCNDLSVRCREIIPDIVILDVSMPGQGVTHCIQRIKKINGNIQILIATMYGHTGLLKRCFDAGATGFVTKASSGEVFLKALDSVANKKIFIEPGLAESMALSAIENKNDPDHHFVGLSPREFDIFLSIARGESIEDISNEMHISRKTVANYKAKIKKYLGVSTTASFVHIALKEGLIN